jgi:hypothetical protein
MRSFSRPHWPCPSESDAGRTRPRIAWALAVACALGNAGCGGDDAVCGPADAPLAGATIAVEGAAGDATVAYGDFTSSPNNDCPPPEGGPTSLTIEGTQADLAPGERFSMVLCLPRPDEIGSAPVALDDDRLVQLVDVNARLDGGCTLRLDASTAPGGTLTFAGYCGDGNADSGYALTFDGSAAGTRTCPDGAGGSTEEPATITLTGSVAVEAITF